MNFLRRNWLIVTLLGLILATMAFFMRSQLGIWLGGWEKSKFGGYIRLVDGKKWDKMPGPHYHVIYNYLVLGPDGDTIVHKANPEVEQHSMYPSEVTNELQEALQMGAPGSKIEVLIPVDSLKLRISNDLKVMNMPAGKHAKFVVKIIKVLNGAEFEGYSTARFFARVEKENKRIDDYAARIKQNWLLDSVRFIKYYLNNKTDAPRLAQGDKVQFHADVYTIDQQMISSSAPTGKPYLMTLGSETYSFVGFDAVLPYLAEGESGTFLVTSDNGFGDKGYMNIVAPYTPLIIIIKDLKKLP